MFESKNLVLVEKEKKEYDGREYYKVHFGNPANFTRFNINLPSALEKEVLAIPEGSNVNVGIDLHAEGFKLKATLIHCKLLKL